MSARKNNRNGNVQLDESKLAEMADETVATETVLEDQIVHGRPLPEGFENPPIGKIGHYCVSDIDGKYYRDWLQLRINRTDEGMPSRQYFCNGASEWWLEIGTWADVPPELLALLECTETEVIDMDMRRANPLTDTGVKKVVSRIPRFSYQVLPSA